jgi:hypothetical protein
MEAVRKAARKICKKLAASLPAGSARDQVRTACENAVNTTTVG